MLSTLLYTARRKSLPTVFNFKNYKAKGSLVDIASSMYNSVQNIPFEISGPCRSLTYEKFGDPTEMLKMTNGDHVWVDETVNSKTERLVHVKMMAAPINPSDINQIQGTYPMRSEGSWHVGGNEGVGKVIAVADDVKNVKKGDFVIPNRGAMGTWRENIIIPEDDVFVLPKTLAENLPIEVLASLLVNPTTAYRLLSDYACIQPNDVIIQNGANSAVGRYIIQIAKLRGIRTVNIVRDRPDFSQTEEELRQLGATTVVNADRFSSAETQDYILQQLNGQRPILALNCVGGVGTVDLANFVADGATVVTYGAMTGKAPIVTTSSLIFRDIKYVGFWMTRWYGQARQDSLMARERTEMFDNLLKMFAEGTLAVPKFEKLSFADHWKSAISYYSSTTNSQKRSSGKPLFIFE